MKLRAFTAIVGTLIGFGSAQAQVVYATTDTEFGTLNLLTGAWTYISTPPDPLLGLGFGKNGVLYGLSGVDEELYTVSSSGVETLVGPTGLIFEGSYDNSIGGGPDGSIYATSGGYMCSIDETTGASTVLGWTGVDGEDQPALDGSGNLYIGDWSDGVLDSINKTTGAPTVIGPLYDGWQYNATFWDDGKMYMTDNGGDIYTLNLSTAAMTFVRNGARITSAASVYNAVPEPSAYAVFGFGALALLRRRKRT